MERKALPQLQTEKLVQMVLVGVAQEQNQLTPIQGLALRAEPELNGTPRMARAVVVEVLLPDQQAVRPMAAMARYMVVVVVVQNQQPEPVPKASSSSSICRT